MGERFYLQQLKAIGTCPGLTPNKSRRKTVAWTDEKKAQAVAMYEEAEPTPETSIEIVKGIAEELEETPNGVRMILTKAGVYVKKAEAEGSSGKPKASAGGTRVSKEDAQSALAAAIKASGKQVDMDIISKLTGKAAVYFAGILAK